MLTYLPDSHFLGAAGGHARFIRPVLKHGDLEFGRFSREFKRINGLCP